MFTKNQNNSTEELSYISGRNARPLESFNSNEYKSLNRLGISNLTESMVRRMMSAVTDSLTPGVTTPSIATPLQFLETWLPGFVHILTTARKIDELVGISTIGDWEMSQIVSAGLELEGTSVPYNDYDNVPFSTWNTVFESRNIVRFMEGMRVGILESERASLINLDSAASKRAAAALALEITRNNIGFFGYNSANQATYGFLNDPGLGAYVTVATGASSSTLWSTKTLLEILADIRNAFATLRTQMGDNLDPMTTPLTLALPTNRYEYLTITSDFGYSVLEWLNKNYPQLRVVSAPELIAANGGSNVFYLYAEKIDDSSTDGGRTFLQMVPTKFRLLGVAKDITHYKEAYSMATAGVLCKRAIAVVRYTGI